MMENENKQPEVQQEKKTEVEEQQENDIDRAERINKETRELLERREKLIAREERIHAQKMLAGKSTIEETEKPKEETPKEYAQRVMSGGLNAKPSEED